eukprot:CAMPEP_0183306296 /NCGR_PEP_ID=MMETSP0160_2-20130417/10760_1 /TAXON_ID=2839 ORGANISM="Odontella Sinensis, Strain Grunow 1884" /NCGR_SAMPLE_ID=MMETSP0160_2 /ASSEMBLY_ACC=CAM_ASM_000250 /LENGTH=618 /DNA_ID=CAMNT_0025469641 /DNA_START=60 /DNA_END=1916 /DNA_ORIENTATION=-
MTALDGLHGSPSAAAHAEERAFPPVPQHENFLPVQSDAPYRSYCNRRAPLSGSLGGRYALAASILALLAVESSGMVLQSPRASTSIVDVARLVQRRRMAAGGANGSASASPLDVGGDYDDLYGALRDASRGRSWTETLFGDIDLEDEDEDEASNLSSALDINAAARAESIEASALRAATGSEIPDMELHLQMEAARRRGDGTAFIDGHVSDATEAEKAAMTAMPMQLPGPAASVVGGGEGTPSAPRRRRPRQQEEVRALKSKKQPRGSTRATSPSKVPTKAISSIMSAKKLSDPLTERVTREEEIELARIVQRGAALHKVKTDFEAEQGRDITRQEWTDLAGLESPRELRRLVASYRQAKSKLVTANMGLVYAVVKSQYGGRVKRTGISKEELVQEGSLGLIRAAELFDPSRGLRFSTYATIWIKGVLSNSRVDETILIPAKETAKYNKIYKAGVDLAMEKNGGAGSALDYKPKAGEIASKVGMKATEVEALTSRMSRAKNLLSLDYSYRTQSRSGNDSSVTDLQNSMALSTDADLVERLQVRADVIAALARNLDPREARLMRLRYGLKDGVARSLKECADAMGISRETARTLALRCLEKLREADDADSLQEYLLTVS